MSEVTNQDLMEKLKKIEHQMRSDKFLFLGFSILGLGITIISIGFVLISDDLIVIGFILSFFGIGLWLIHRELILEKVNYLLIRITTFIIVITIISIGLILFYSGLYPSRFPEIMVFIVFIELWYIYVELKLEKEKKTKEGIKMRFKKHWEKYGRIYKLEALFISPAIISGFIALFLKEQIGLQGLIYLYIALFYFASWFVAIVLIELIRANISEKSIGKLKKRFKKKPKIYEYIFFLGLFWATVMFTDAYSRNILTDIDFFNFINIFGCAIFIYGVSSACGWYHYIERVDDSW